MGKQATGFAESAEAGISPLGTIEHHGHEVAPADAPDRRITALAWIRARRARDKALGAHLFSDPVWDMLLDLYISHCQGRKVSISDLCVISRVPMTTALRWIALLETQKIITRAADDGDRRRRNLDFTVAGLGKMELALDGAVEEDKRLGLGRLRHI